MLLSAASGVESVARLLTTFILFLFVCVITYYTARFVAAFQKSGMRATNIEAVEAYRISNNKYIQIIRIGEKYLAIAVCKDTVTVLCELTENEIIPIGQGENPVPVDFKEILEKIKHVKKMKKQADKDE